MFPHYYFNKYTRFVIHKNSYNRSKIPPHYYLAFAHISSLYNYNLPNDDISTFIITTNTISQTSSHYNNHFKFNNTSRQSSIDYFSYI